MLYRNSTGINPNSENELELSVVVLCYQANDRIIDFSYKLKNNLDTILINRYEIILVGNYLKGKEDRTSNIIKELSDKEVVFKAISEPKAGMMGWDVRKGLSKTLGKYICFVDGDGQFPIESIVQCYKKIKETQVGLVKTYREKRHDGIQRNIISKCYNITFKVLYPFVKSKDINSKPKLFSREVYNQLSLSYDDWFIDAEIMIKVSRLGIPYKEIPIEFLKLEGRKSLVNVSTIMEFIINMLTFPFKKKD